jgi:hypothetical protein
MAALSPDQTSTPEAQAIPVRAGTRRGAYAPDRG